MKGCRPLTDEEIEKVLAALSRNTFAARDRALFMIGLKTGFRISELLSLRVKDVFIDDKIAEEISVGRQYMKGKKEGRSVPFLNERAHSILRAWLDELGTSEPERFLFTSRLKSKTPIDRKTAWKMLKKAYAVSEAGGKVATHTMRKTFAKHAKRLVNNDMQAVQKMMGHKQVETTIRYTEADDDVVNEAFRKL